MAATTSQRERLIHRVARYIQATDDEGAPPYEYAEFVADYLDGSGPFRLYSGPTLGARALGDIWAYAEQLWELGV